MLDGLLHHGTLLKIGTHYTDTGGASDHVFILCALLGFRFCPRLRDLPDRKLACIAPASTYPDLQPLLGQRIKTELIREHWSETIRLVASLKTGTVAPSAMLRKLAAYHAAILTRPELTGRRFSAVAAARSHRKSPDRLRYAPSSAAMGEPRIGR